MLLVYLIVFVAFFLRSGAGFGGALLCVPLMSTMFTLQFVIPFETLLELVLSLFLLPKIIKSVQWKVLVPLIIGALIGTLFGSILLKNLSTSLLPKRFLGCFVVIYGVYLLFFHQQTYSVTSNYIGLLMGILGGLSGSILGVSGPLFVIYLASTIESKNGLYASLVALFFVDFAWRFLIFCSIGLYTSEIILLAFKVLPFLAVATILGYTVFQKVNMKVFHYIVAILIVVSGFLVSII